MGKSRFRFARRTAGHVRGGLPAHEARDIRWHASQTKVELPDGRLQITLQLNNLVDIRTAILRHGPDAEALAPAELRATLAADAAKMHAMYSRPPQPVVAASPTPDANARVES